MANIINFNKAGKKIAKIKQEKQAVENRATFGQKKPAKRIIKKEIKALKDHLDAHKISDKDDNGDKERS
ncbi:MAG: DUF4169 family protein [Emcibacter sp.]|nr:DUF4169 family protein [Emcibacter sp.]